MMTDSDIMPAGPEIDRLVADRVMGWEPTVPHGFYWKPKGTRAHPLDLKYGTDSVHGQHFSPSTNIAHAWEVVEGLKARGLPVHVYCGSQRGDWLCQVGELSQGGQGTPADARADTAPLVICRAALKAIR